MGDTEMDEGGTEAVWEEGGMSGGGSARAIGIVIGGGVIPS